MVPEAIVAIERREERVVGRLRALRVGEQVRVRERVAQVLGAPGDAELHEVGLVHEHDLGLDRDLPRLDVQLVDDRDHLRDPHRHIGDDDGVRLGVGGDRAAQGAELVHRLNHVLGRDERERDHARLQVLELLDGPQVRDRVDADDPVFVGDLVAVRAHDRDQRLVPGHVVDRGRDRARHLRARHDRDAPELREGADHRLDVGVLEVQADGRAVDLRQARIVDRRRLVRGIGRSRGVHIARDVAAGLDGIPWGCDSPVGLA